MSSIQNKKEEIVVKSIPVFMNKKTYEIYSRLTPRNRTILFENASYYFSEVLISMIQQGYLDKEEYE